MNDDPVRSTVQERHAPAAGLPAPLRAMIFARDRKLVVAFADAVAELPLDWVLVEDKCLAEQFIGREKFDLLIADCATDGGTSLIRYARTGEVNHACVIFGISRAGADESLLQLGADVYLSSPGELACLSTKLAETLPLMKHDRRRSPRCPVAIPASLRRGEEIIPATVLTLSEGGMMIHVRHDVPDYDVLRIAFEPVGAAEMQLYGKIAWRGPDCLAGIRFLGLTDEQKKNLGDWVRAQPMKAANPAGYT